jgi:3-hydroxyacyl-CoA dehydrogenase/enoyl-CoA hydratase/3-hydroxybutyryl-CoA epimerase
MITTNYQHWHLEKDQQNILWLYLDKQNSRVNTLDEQVLGEFEKILTDIAQENNIKGVVITSKKSTGFIAGADIEKFKQFTSVEEAKQFIRHGQIVFNQLESLRIPTVALITGFCLGGGLELALACHYRIAEDSDHTRLGLPEVLLGIHPGWGGSVRLPRLIGALDAIPLILSGRIIQAKEAKRLGIVDDVVPTRELHAAATFFILNQPKLHDPGFLKSLTNSYVMRVILAKIFNAQTAKKIKPQHYPAPFSVIDNWLNHGVYGEEAYLAEADSLAKIALTDTAKNLVRVFFLQEKLKGLGKEIEFKAKHVHVIGAGVMGGDIAAWCALKGLHVTLSDNDPNAIGKAIGRAYKFYQKKLKELRKIQAVMDRLVPDMDGNGIRKADVIIEAIIEKLAAKQGLFTTIESQAKESAILATNTSSIPLEEIATSLKNPARLVGLHFFNPVAKMQLIEVIRSKITDQKIFNQAMAFVVNIGKLPVPVKSSPGFLVNRALMPYLMEAMKLIEEGVPGPVIDKAAIDFGMPMGPIELADAVGLDICLSVAENLVKHYGDQVPNKLRAMVAEHRLGRKTNKGFYNYHKGRAVKEISKNYKAPEDIGSRLILRMLNEVMACKREDIVPDSDLLDAGMIFGTGFAPFTGGPMHYIEKINKDNLKQQLQDFSKLYGERFEPDPAWS